MLSFLTEKMSVPAEFVSQTGGVGKWVATEVLGPRIKTSISYAFTLYSTVYEPISPYITQFSLLKQGIALINDPKADFVAWGNFALTVLSLPKVNEGLTQGIEATTGLDKETIGFYLNSTITCLSMAAIILPKISHYLQNNAKGISKEEVMALEKNIENINQQLQGVLVENVKKNPKKGEKAALFYQYKKAEKEEPTSPSHGKNKHKKKGNS